MSDLKQSDSIYTLRSSGEGRVLLIEIHAKYLNYDISDGLKVRLREAIQKELDRGTRYYVLDLSKVSIVDSCGVGLMIGIHNLIREHDGLLYLTGVTQFLEKIFRMMHLDQYFRVVESEQAVLEKLSPAT